MDTERASLVINRPEVVKVTYEHRLVFRTPGRGRLGWTVRDIERVRHEHKIPDEADLLVTNHSVVFIWGGRVEGGLMRDLDS